VTDIASVKNPRVVAVTRLHRRKHRRAERRTILEGPHVITEALESGIELLELYTLDPADDLANRAAGTDCPVFRVTPVVMQRLAPTEHPRGPIAVISVPAATPPRHHDAIVMVGVADPGNAGTIIRSAAAFDHDVIVWPGIDIWSPKVVRAGAGGHFRTRIIGGAPDPAALHTIGITTAALVVSDGLSIDAVGPGPVALFVGSEPHGLPDEVRAACDRAVTLPMSADHESLNAAVAASIAMWERFRSR
jgi:TrmH family RNA methyltransferase